MLALWLVNNPCNSSCVLFSVWCYHICFISDKYFTLAGGILKQGWERKEILTVISIDYIFKHYEYWNKKVTFCTCLHSNQCMRSISGSVLYVWIWTVHTWIFLLFLKVFLFPVCFICGMLEAQVACIWRKVPVDSPGSHKYFRITEIVYLFKNCVYYIILCFKLSYPWNNLSQFCHTCAPSILQDL